MMGYRSNIILSLLLGISSLIYGAVSFQPPTRPRTTFERARASASRTPPTQHSPCRDTALSLNSISPAAALSAVGSPIGSVAVLAFVILVHEAGHFIAARSLGIDVDEFSVGVGPRIVGVRQRVVDDKMVFEKINDVEMNGESVSSMDGIDFSLRAIPFGGYVRFPENYNRTLAFEQEDAARKARNKARLMRIEDSSKLEKTLEYLAANSFLFNLLSLGLLKKWQSERESEQLLRAQEEVKMNSRRLISKNNNQVGGAMWWNKLPWVATKVEEQELGSKLAILTAANLPEVEYSDDPNLLQNRPWHERAIVLSGGVVFNLLLAFACYFGEFAGGRGLPKPVFDAGAVVSQMPSKESPSFGLLTQGDVIVGINDMITSSTNYKSGIWASQKEMSDIISVIRETPLGENVKLTIVHGRGSDNKDEISVYPKKNTDGLMSIGVSLMPNYVRTDVVFASSIVDAIAKAGSAVYELTSETAQSFVRLLFGVLLGKGLPAGTNMSGPLGVIKTGTEVVKGSDFAAIVSFAASISINLAVVNSLPLPALDGGQLVFVLAEAAAGRRIDQRVQEGINAGSLLILLLISFGAAVGDVASIFN
ncbi:hypothetical protein ACHAXH_002868 [Discostella pseudostelligera]